jgi:hypothetical protein
MYAGNEKITKNLEKTIDKLLLICYHITVNKGRPQIHGVARTWKEIIKMAYYIDNRRTGMTYGEALAQGYKRGDLQSMMGYQSRAKDCKEFPVYVGKGSRKGQLFVVLPRYDTKRYCYRQYLTR